jgi:tetratricopeptide (TPR) repeat protein
MAQTLLYYQHEIGSRLNSGDLAGAAALAAECRKDWPSDRAGWLFGSITALLEGNPKLSLALVEEHLTADPADTQCLLQKAECLLALGNGAAALAAAAAAAATTNDGPAALDAIGEFMVHAGEHRRALEIYHRAVASSPTHPTLRAKRADLHRILGEFDLAASDYEAVLALAPGTPKALKGLVELRRQSAERNSIAALQAALTQATPGTRDAAILHFGLAKSYTDLGEHALSWQHLATGNAFERAQIQYSPATDREAIDRMIAAFPDLESKRPDTTGARPIFIVGLPRTGTTLVERILGNHSQVHSAGEITALPEAIEQAIRWATQGNPVDGPKLTAVFHELEGEAIAAEYLALSHLQRGDRPRFTDKLPSNFLSCALILRAFPNAHIVHLTRHPLAACYAIYRTRFAGTYPFAYDLMEIAEFYVGYRRLMAHWRRVLPGRILDVAYEDLVTALEPTTRLMLQHLDLPFEARCLEFYSNPTPVKTTSSVQVRQPVYDSSLTSWQHHATQLAPVRAHLEAAGIPID